MSKSASRFGFVVLLLAILFGTVFLFGHPGRPAGSSANNTIPASNIPTPIEERNQALSARAQAQKQTDLDQNGDLRPLTTPEVVKLSTRIVMAKCSSVDVKELTGGNIFTFTAFEAVELLKGKLDSKNFTLRLYGGRLGNREIHNSSMPQFAVGEEVILSLGSDNLDGYPTIIPQGTFRIALDPESKQRIVVTRAPGLQMFKASDQQPYSATLSVPLDDFLFSLRRLINSK